MLEVLIADQSKVGLVDEGGGVEGMPRLLMGQLRRRELAQLVVDQRQQIGRVHFFSD
jgi:hypothetical protein